MSTDITTTSYDDAQPSTALTLAEQWRFAEAVTGSGGSILPKAYRQDPGAVLVAVNLGAAMGLSPAESLYRIHVVEGKPSASAELIAANVRKAGHRLRIRATNETATVQIIRADDPEFAYEVTWTIQDAERAGLTGKDVWRKYPASMLRARAVTECARTACPEALYGVIYATEEVQDVSTAAARPPRESAADIVAATTPSTTPSPGHDAATTSYDDTPETAPRPAGADPEPEPVTTAQLKKLGVLMREADITERTHALAYVSETIGRDVTSRSELSKDEASTVINALQTFLSPDEEADRG